MSAVATDILFSSPSILSSNSNSHRRSRSRQASSSTKKQDRQSVGRNQVFTDTAVDSFFISSANITQSAIEGQKPTSSSAKRYVSSFKTLVNSTSGKHNQRISYANDSVIIVKLSKENPPESVGSTSQVTGKNSVLSIASTTPPPRQSSSSPPLRLSPVLKVEGQKRRTNPYDSSVNPSANSDIITVSNLTHSMAMSASSHPSSNPSLFAYRNTITANSTVRPRAIAETTTTSLFITTERLKSNTSSAMRPARQPSTATTAAVATAAMSSVYLPSQPAPAPQPHRSIIQNIKPRIHQEKSTNSKDLFEYPDPFTNCPQELLSKLAQLTKLQLETVEWEKKRRYIKKKPIANSTNHGKDSPLRVLVKNYFLCRLFILLLLI